ncbi:hypothetical protein J5N97_027030 [Dioscorea zingiberensis]|uniref:Uncharacterized protein n=1 Tax=Dioscorea zingiberensis TaxID=325984 RepID=A0A9D5C4J2_9LILI|nr:hypothetical protein J5N97_027030 [Dioscorea zingiberensis]
MNLLMSASFDECCWWPTADGHIVAMIICPMVFSHIRMHYVKDCVLVIWLDVIATGHGKHERPTLFAGYCLAALWYELNSICKLKGKAEPLLRY